MPTLVLRTPEGVALRREIAGAGSRFAAGLLDSLLLAAGYAALATAALLLAQVDVTGASSLVGGLLLAGFQLSALAYFLIFHLLGRGATPGKRAMGLLVTSADGFPATPLQLALRTLLWPIDVLIPIPVSLGVLVILLTEKRQRLGDLAAGTIVVRQSAPQAAKEPFEGESWSRLAEKTLPLSAGMAARLSADDYELLRDLWTRAGLEPDERRRLFISAARQYSDHLGLGPFQDARVVLKELYLFLRESREDGAFRVEA